MSGNMNEDNPIRGNAALKALREKAGLNRMQIAKAMGITTRMWQRYENEGRPPDKIDFVLKLAALTDTPVDEVLKLLGFKVPDREELLSLIDKSAEV